MIDRKNSALAANASLAQRIEAFRDSVSPSLYSPETFISWSSIEERLHAQATAIDALQHLTNQDDRDVEALAEILAREPGTLSIIRGLFAIAPSHVGFADGRNLLSRAPSDPTEGQSLARLLIDLGIWNLLHTDTQVRDLVRIAEIARDAQRRRFRRSEAAENKLESIVRSAVDQAAAEYGIMIALVDPRSFNTEMPRAISYAFAVGDRPVAALASVFQDLTGGRQQRDLELTYPSLQLTLDAVPASLILIADGRGLARTPEHILKELFQSVAACMTLAEAASGSLVSAIIEAARSYGERRSTLTALDRLISSALEKNLKVDASDLPASSDDARLALAGYATRHPSLSLDLSPLGDSLGWKNPDLVASANALKETFDGATAVLLLADLLGANVLKQTGSSSAGLEVHLEPFTLDLDEDPILPRNLVCVPFTHRPNASLLRSVATLSIRSSPDGKLAIVLTPSSPMTDDDLERSRLQRTLPANVVMVDTDGLAKMTRSIRPPRSLILEMVLRQADLTKVSPFVVNSVTPERVFYGRDVEEATLTGTLPTNSIALLGARRIGKTSLMKHAMARLEESGFRPVFGDCQIVRTWSDFGTMVKRRWNLTLPAEFIPEHLFNLVSLLNDGSGRMLVILLDEIDQLLSWDQQHSDAQVPEAFFRTCRSISQEGLAQFVFSGERVIAKKLWDPQSPHWNFCRQLPLQQLDRENAERLLLTPLRSLQVNVGDESSFRSLAWKSTSGHPQILQFLGDALVHRLNDEEPRLRTSIGLDDLERVVETYEFAEHYITTYWGQATSLERLLSLCAMGGMRLPSEMFNRVTSLGVVTTEDSVADGLRMLELYGILQRHSSGYILRAEWFPRALDSYGGLEHVMSRYAEEVA